MLDLGHATLPHTVPTSCRVISQGPFAISDSEAATLFWEVREFNKMSSLSGIMSTFHLLAQA